MQYKKIYIYEDKDVFIGEFMIKGWGEDITMGQAIKPLLDRSNVDDVKETLEQRMFQSLFVVEYAIKNKIKQTKLLDKKGNIKEKLGLEILENIKQSTKYEILHRKPKHGIM